MSIKFVDYDSEKVLSDLVKNFEEVLGETLQPSDERRLFLNALASTIVSINASINDTGNQVLLRTARGEALDAIGEMFGVERLPASSAVCDLVFTLSSEQSAVVTIPIGTRVTPDGKVYFATNKTLVIPAGDLTGMVSAVALEAGSMHNGYVEGQVKYIVDNIPYLQGVENTSVTTGGTDEENDEHLRERIRLVNESYSTAGCAESYIFWAKSASAEVGDVAVTSPNAGEVNVYIIKADGSVPEEGDHLLDAVNDIVSANDKRPLTDKVTVLPPTKVQYSVELEYYVSPDDEKDLANIHQRVTEAVNEYIKWQSGKIGRDINTDKLRKLVFNAGASAVEIYQPVGQAVDVSQIAVPDDEVIVRWDGIIE